MTETFELTEYLAAYVGNALPSLAVYSAVDPVREWVGTETIEFGERQKPTTQTFLSGAAQEDRALVCYCRSASRQSAQTLALTLRRTIDAALDSAVESDDRNDPVCVVAYSFYDLNVEGDDRGVTTGETFVGSVTFNVLLRRNIT